MTLPGPLLLAQSVDRHHPGQRCGILNEHIFAHGGPSYLHIGLSWHTDGDCFYSRVIQKGQKVGTAMLDMKPIRRSF